MILVDLPAGQTLYRAHTPKWASQPLSGAGAAMQGGRFNRPGIPALYLSLEIETAAAEYQQTSSLLPPATLCSYVARLSPLVDLRQLRAGAPWDPLWQDWREDWRALYFDQHVEPPSWVLSDLVRAQGCTGIIFPSQARPPRHECGRVHRPNWLEREHALGARPEWASAQRPRQLGQ